MQYNSVPVRVMRRTILASNIAPGAEKKKENNIFE